jgi:hypothetical protein
MTQLHRSAAVSIVRFMKCSNCGTESKGNFCSSCGAALRSGDCAECGTTLPPVTRFCTRCGHEAGSAGAAADRPRRVRRGPRTASPAAGSNLPWYIAGAALIVAIIVLLVPMFTGGDSVPDRGAAPFGAVAPGGGPPPLSGTPREQGDRLFNRIMAAREQGNTAEAQQFAPMAIQAYEAAEPLDDDGIYHVAMVHIVLGDYDAAIATAERILSRNPNHLLGLAAAAEAAESAGDQAAALNYYRRYVDAYPSEVGRGLIEYQDHARILPDHLELARQRVRQPS